MLRDTTLHVQDLERMAKISHQSNHVAINICVDQLLDVNYQPGWIRLSIILQIYDQSWSSYLSHPSLSQVAAKFNSIMEFFSPKEHIRSTAAGMKRNFVVRVTN